MYNEKIMIQITSGQGPDECELTVSMSTKLKLVSWPFIQLQATVVAVDERSQQINKK